MACMATAFADAECSLCTCRSRPVLTTSKWLPRAGLRRRSKTTQTVSAKSRAAEDQASVVHHKVKSGETLYSIANAYRTTVAALKRDNKDVATLRPGMILIVQQSR